MRDRFNFDKVIQNIASVKRGVVRDLTIVTKKYFLASFDKSEWDGVPWKDVKRHSKKGGSQRNQSKTLVQTGTLRRAVNNSLVKESDDKIIFIVKGSLSSKGYNYGKIHNDGGHAGRAPGFLMPQRRFMGDTKSLRKIQLSTIKKYFRKVW